MDHAAPWSLLCRHLRRHTNQPPFSNNQSVADSGTVGAAAWRVSEKLSEALTISLVPFGSRMSEKVYGPPTTVLSARPLMAVKFTGTGTLPPGGSAK